ncbi:hypothetical protein ACLQ2R_07410 [Streptosporangium sp. DT93]|uniref:hypothetical protein n=1 Tax=Streptosporangium sp. DT93 TaxID=3393428 RepID=UPI003CED24FD
MTTDRAGSDRAGSDAVHEALTRILMENTAVEDPYDTEDFLRLVAGAAALQGEATTLLRTTVASARAAGVTWQSIGATLGMTKQAAQKRFAPPLAPSGTGLDPRERILGPTTTFDEMRELALAGRYGWHSVEFGAAYHRVVRSGTQWEHARVTVSPMSPGRVRGLSAEGWEVIGSGFPYTYLKRDTGVPALQEPPPS